MRPCSRCDNDGAVRLYCISSSDHTSLWSRVQEALQLPFWVRGEESAALDSSAQGGACARACALRQALAALQKPHHLLMTGTARLLEYKAHLIFSSRGAAILRFT